MTVECPFIAIYLYLGQEILIQEANIFLNAINYFGSVTVEKSALS